MELYTHAFVSKVGFALFTSICPSGHTGVDAGSCIQAETWIDDVELSQQGHETCIRIAERQRKLVVDGTVDT